MVIRTRLSEQAAADLRSIYLTSAKSFGRRQADIYIDGILAAIDDLRSFPERGRSAGTGRHFRILRFKSHRLLYRIEQDTVLISRILHYRQLISGL